MEIKEIQDDQYWIDAFVSGEEVALSHFFKLHAGSLGYFTNRLLHDAQESEDIVANCFVKLWERRAKFKTTDNIKAFLYVSCRNACLDHFRHLKVRTVAQQSYYQELEQSEETVLYHIIRSEVLVILNREIELLPDNYRDVFKLIYFEQQKTDEIADQLGLSVQTVRNYKARAVELLKTAMLKKGVSALGILVFLLYFDGK